jgi:hypoxanthine phosphoribosyltransferase
MIKRISWQEVSDWITTISDDVKEMRFDYLYGIPRGGLVPAVMLSHQTNIPLLLDYSYEGICPEDILRNQSGEKPYRDFPARNHLDYSRILFVDDIIHSGETFRRYSQWIDPLEGYDHRFLSLVKNETYNHEDIWRYGFDATKEDWVVFPWEKELESGQAQELIVQHIGEQSSV